MFIIGQITFYRPGDSILGFQLHQFVSHLTAFAHKLSGRCIYTDNAILLLEIGQFILYITQLFTDNFDSFINKFSRTGRNAVFIFDNRFPININQSVQYSLGTRDIRVHAIYLYQCRTFSGQRGRNKRMINICRSIQVYTRYFDRYIIIGRYFIGDILYNKSTSCGNYSITEQKLLAFVITFLLTYFELIQ